MGVDESYDAEIEIPEMLNRLIMHACMLVVAEMIHRFLINLLGSILDMHYNKFKRLRVI